MSGELIVNIKLGQIDNAIFTAGYVGVDTVGVVEGLIFLSIIKSCWMRFS